MLLIDLIVDSDVDTLDTVQKAVFIYVAFLKESKNYPNTDEHLLCSAEIS